MSENGETEAKTVNCVVTGEPGDPAKMVLLPCVTGSGTRSFVPTMHPLTKEAVTAALEGGVW